ncbi:MAG: hypothetical protein VX619_09040 [bacterium]|nr:hypothetical protein [bacterium]
MDSNFLVDLDQDHPGFTDATYRAQRDQIARLATKYLKDREIDKEINLPEIEYENHQHELWTHLYTTILSRYRKYAVQDVYNGLLDLKLNPKRIPSLGDVNKALFPRTGFKVVPVSGLVTSRYFFSSLQNREFYCTQYIRHHSKPDFTPEPDICHDVIGHVPLLMDPKIARCYVQFAKAATKASDEQIKKLENLYWFTVEYGLVYEEDELKTWGAGNLSSYSDLRRCVDAARVQHLEFDIEMMCGTEYDPTIQQPRLFVAKNLNKALDDLGDYFRSEYGIED